MPWRVKSRSMAPHVGASGGGTSPDEVGARPQRFRGAPEDLGVLPAGRVAESGCEFGAGVAARAVLVGGDAGRGHFHVVRGPEPTLNSPATS
jgi:hypothetical protein